MEDGKVGALLGMQHDDYPALAGVKREAEGGRISKALEELVEYFRNRAVTRSTSANSPGRYYG
jgi:hypothetical protein